MESPDYAIRVSHVSKTFRVHLEKNHTLKEKLLYAKRAKYRDFVALSDVSLDIRRGTTVGLLGVNGSGKSTLLKLISRILYPDSGTIEVRGRVSSLLELGAGFHPDFTGIENIYLNGSLMGLTKREIAAKLEEIIDFSELGDFIREPIRGYSSGMYMRLAFSVAVAVDPEILLIDEILAVGDAAFQAKCMDRLKQLQALNRTIVLVSHDTGAVERFCDTAVWLHNSQMRMDGDPVEVTRAYLTTVFKRAHEGTNVMSFNRAEPEETAIQKPERSQGPARDEASAHETPIEIEKVLVRRVDGDSVIRCGDDLEVVVHARTRPGVEMDLDGMVVSLQIYTQDETLVFSTNTLSDLKEKIAAPSSAGTAIALSLESCPISGGVYPIEVRIASEYGEPLAFYRDASGLSVICIGDAGGIVHMDRKWEIEQLEDANALGGVPVE